MKFEKITDDNLVLAIVIRKADWEEGLNFISADDDFMQVGIWGYNEGQKLNPHIHLKESRKVLRTQEVIFVANGRVRADIYTEQEKFLKSVELDAGDAMVLLNGGHGYEILDDDTRVLEIKNGPYVGAERDRKRI